MKLFWCGFGVLALITVIGFFVAGGSITMAPHETDREFDSQPVERFEDDPVAAEIHRPRNPLYRVLDEDEDGEVSKEELENAPNRLLRLDTNNDGELSKEELRWNFGRFGKKRPPLDDEEKNK